jgi:hypothetical protein
LRDVVSIKSERGKYVLFTKSQFNDEKYTTLDFLQQKENAYAKEKRDGILSNLHQILPGNRKQFWENIMIHNN